MTAEQIRAIVRSAADGLRAARGNAEGMAAALKPIRMAGLCDQALDPRWGGGGLPMTAILATITEASRVDGSVGFLLSQSALGHMITAGFPDDVHRQMHGTRPASVAGVFAPKGRAARTGSGWTISGRWSLATGAVLSDWLYLQCLVFERRRLTTYDDGRPVAVLAVIPREDDVEIERTWQGPGLAETASDRVAVTNVQVPEARVGRLQDGPGGSASSIPLRPFPAADRAGLPIGAVAVGLAGGLVEEVARIGTRGRRAAYSAAPTAETAADQRDLGSAAMLVETASGLLDRAAGDDFGSTLEGRAKRQASTATAVRLCLHAADLAYTLAGSAGLDRDALVWRRYADLRTVAQHAWCSQARTAPLGAVLMGAEPDPSILRRSGPSARPPGD